jgi:hypothetical protein
MAFRLMAIGLAAAAGLSAAPVLAKAQPQAGTMSVATFLTKAESLRKKGPLALMSSDLKLVTNQIKADSESIRSERQAAIAAGRPQNHCPPASGVKMTDKDIIEAMQAVPAAERARTSTREALRSAVSDHLEAGDSPELVLVGGQHGQTMPLH